MNNTNQNHTDNFFKQGLSSPPEFTPSDKNWKEMERLLKPGTRRRSIGWIYPVSGIAAAMLIFLSLWLVSDKTNTTTQPAGVTKSAQKNPGPATEANSHFNSVKSGDSRVGDSKILQEEGVDASHRNFGRTLLSGNNDAVAGTNVHTPLLTSKSITDHRSAIIPVNTARYTDVQLSSSNQFASQRITKITVRPANTANTVVDSNREPEVRVASGTGRWALGLAISPDVNSVKGMDNGNLGVSMGMGLSYKLLKGLSLGTGVYYSQKLYSADKTSYKVTEKPFATWTSYAKKITADCRVIDVPVNLSLQLSNKTQNKLSATAGLSSYIMLSEKYDFAYNVSPMYPTGHREYTVRNENKHILSVVNLGIALEKPLTDQVSLVIQPYAKLPLTGIGQGETDLKSVGVGFRLNYSLKKKN